MLLFNGIDLGYVLYIRSVKSWARKYIVAYCWLILVWLCPGKKPGVCVLVIGLLATGRFGKSGKSILNFRGLKVLSGKSPYTVSDRIWDQIQLNVVQWSEDLHFTCGKLLCGSRSSKYPIQFSYCLVYKMNINDQLCCLRQVS